MVQSAKNIAAAVDGIRRAKPGIEDGPWFEGQPDEEPPTAWTDAKDARRCDLMEQAEEVGLSAVQVDEYVALRDEMLAHRRKVAPLPIDEARAVLKSCKRPTWHSVDEPPEDTRSLWVTDGTWVLDGHRDVENGRFVVDVDRNVVYGTIIAWQTSNRPRAPGVHWQPEPEKANAWISVDEPPEDGTWCWVIAHGAICFARKEPADQWAIADRGYVTSALFG